MGWPDSLFLHNTTRATMIFTNSKNDEHTSFQSIFKELPDAESVQRKGREDGRDWQRSWMSFSSPAFREEKPPVPPVHREDKPSFEVELKATAERLRREIDEQAERRKEALRGERERIRVNGGAAQERFDKVKQKEARREDKLKAIQEKVDKAPRPTLSQTAMVGVESVTAVGEGALASVALYGIDVPLIFAGCGGLISGVGVACIAHDLGKRANKSSRSGGENIGMVLSVIAVATYVLGVSYARYWYVEGALGLESGGFTFWLFAAISAILVLTAFLASYAGHTTDLRFRELSEKKAELKAELDDLRSRRQEVEEELVKLGSELRQVENALERLPDRVEAAKETVSETIGERIDAYRTANVRARPDGEIPQCWRSANGASTHVH